MNKILLNFFFIFAAILFLSSCEKKETARTYSEVTEDSSLETAAPTSDPHAGLNIDLNTPMPGMDSKNDPHAGFTKEQLAQMLSASGVQNVSESPISWTLPEGWQEKPATGMRIATFGLKNNESAVDCSIVSLGAGAGGIEPNIIRWLGQLNLEVLPPAELQAFIAKQETLTLDANVSALVIDFTELQKKSAPVTPSMLAAIIEANNQRIFVKMTGSREKVLEQSKAFKALVKSLKFKN